MCKAIALSLSMLLLSGSVQAAPAHVPLGVNSNNSSYYTPDFIFKNMMYKIVEWKGYDTGKLNRPVAMNFDPDGNPYPSPDQPYAGFQTWIAIHGLPGYTGNYVVLWDGDGDVRVDDNGGAFPGSQFGKNRGTFTMSKWSSLWDVWITRSNPADPVRNIRLIQAEFESNYVAEPYHPDFLRLLSTFHTFRFMDLSGVSSVAESHGASGAVQKSPTTVQIDAAASSVNDYYKGWILGIAGTHEWPRRLVTGYDGATKTLTVSPAFAAGELVPSPYAGVSKFAPEKWSQRTRPGELRQGTARGMAIEHMVGLCNRTHVNPWINIPNIADDDYVRQMAIYFRDNLDPTLKIYIEWSNETWNFGGYPGFDTAYAYGKLLGLPGNFVWGYHAYRATHIFHIWNEVFNQPDLSSQRGSNRLVRLLASQAGYASGPTTVILNFNGWPAGDPFIGHKASEYADALAIAPYFGGLPKEKVPTSSMTELLDMMEANIGYAKDHYIKDSVALAQAANLDVVAYEGGQSIEFSAASNEEWNISLAPYLTPMFKSPRWRSLIVEYLEMWSSFGKNAKNKGVDLFCLYNMMGGLSKYGYWGHRDQQIVSDDPNPRWQGILDYLANRQTPVPPNELYADPISGHEVKLHWYDNSHNETGFELQRRRDPDPDFQLLTSLAAGATAYLDGGLQSGQTYIYRVRATNLSGPSEYSTEARAVMPTDDTVLPERPASLVAVPESDSTIRLRWRDMSSTETKFVIERKDPNTSVFNVVGEALANNVMFIDDGLTHDLTYTYRVSAFRGAYGSAPSNESAARTWGPAAGAPLLFAATLVPPNDVKLSWKDNSADEKAYSIKRKLLSDTAYTPLVSLAPNTTQYFDFSLDPGTYIYVLQTTKADNSVVTNGPVMQIVPDAGAAPLVPERLTGFVPVSGEVDLAWTDMSSDETGFVVERRPATSQAWGEVGRTLPNAATYKDFPNLGISDSYFYRVKATGALRNSGYSNELQVHPGSLGRAGESVGSGGNGSGAVVLPQRQSLSILCKTSNPPCSLVLRIVSRAGVVKELHADAVQPATDIEWDLRNNSNTRLVAGSYRINADCGGKIETVPVRFVVVN